MFSSKPAYSYSYPLNTPQESIAEHLSHLQDLRQLFIHLDMPGASVPVRWAPKETQDLFEHVRDTTGDRVRILAAGLSTIRIEWIYMLKRYSRYTTKWAAWDVKRHEDEGERKDEGDGDGVGRALMCTRMREWDIECVVSSFFACSLT